MAARIRREVFAILGAVVFVLALPASSLGVPVAVTGSGIYAPLPDAFTIEYEAGIAGLDITMAVIDISTCADSDGCVFDAPFATASWLLIGTPGKTSPAEGGVADGATSITFLFSDFNVGERYAWTIDVDEAVDASFISGSEFAGSTLALTFAGPGYLTTTLTGTYVYGFHSCGLFPLFGGCVSVSGDVPEALVPEPSTLFLLGSGLAGLGFIRRRKRAA